jgi:hypothetical protein
MGRRAASLVLAVACACWGTGVAAQTVDDVVHGYVQARGGLARLRSVTSLRLRGTLELGSVSSPFVIELKRPGKMRTEFSVEGRTAVRAFDGRTGWVKAPLPGEPARAMDAEDAAEARAQADVDLSPLVDAAAKGCTVELVGRDRLLEGETWKLVVREKDRPPRTISLDARTHLVVRVEDRRTLDGREVDFVTEVGDYRPVDGILFPHRFETGPRGSMDRQRLLVQRVEVNPPLDDERFEMPAAGSSEPSPPARPAAHPVLR